MQTPTNDSFSRKLIVVDTDAGIDDAWAIVMLIAEQAKRCDVKILGITCVHGNAEVEQTCINVLRTLESTLQLEIPVYKGASSPLVKVNDGAVLKYFGEDGFGCAEHKNTLSMSLIEKENAVVALNDIISENKGKVSLLCLGPLTNIALAIRTYPDFADCVKEVVIMGGNYQGVGNTTDCAEFNFYADPEAAHIVFSSSIKEKVLVPWETCYQAVFSLDWRDNVLGACENGPVKLLNRVERLLREKPTFKEWMCCDQVAAAVLLDPSVATDSKPCHVSVELSGHYTRGQVVLDHVRKQPPNATIIKQIDVDRFTCLLLGIHCLV